MSDQPWKKFERTVAEQVSLWLSDNKCRTVVARQALMGRMVERKYGDLATHPDCPEKWRPAADWFMRTWQVDAKNRKAFRLAAILSQKGNPMWEWWAKLTHQAATSAGKMRMMVLQHGGLHVLVLGCRERGWLFDQAGIKRVGFPQFSVRCPPFDDPESETLTFCKFESWLKFIPADSIGCPTGAVKEKKDDHEGIDPNESRGKGPSEGPKAGEVGCDSCGGTVQDRE